MKPFFSIVVPCCDVEQYVRESLDSVLNQGFADWECVIGVETSKDRTEEVVREYAARDPRFKVFTGPRSGSCSASRNTGVDMATGEYVIFLDGDDTIAEGALQRLHDRIAGRPGADIYQCAMLAINEMTGERELRDNFVEGSPEEMTGVRATLEIDRLWAGKFCPMLQLSVFRREFLVAHGLKCVYGLRRQDSEFTPRALYFAKRVVPLHEAFYVYRIRENSVSTEAKGRGHFLRDWAVITKSLLAFHAKVSHEDGFDERVVPCWIRQWLPPLFFYWFNARTVKSVPRSWRVETLQVLFADGFGDFDELLARANFAKRTAGRVVAMFVRHPSMRWLAELCFKFYFFLIRIKSGEGPSFCKAVPDGSKTKGVS